MLPDDCVCFIVNAPEYCPARCGHCGEHFAAYTERAEIAPIGKEEPTEHLIVHVECYFNNMNTYELA